MRQNHTALNTQTHNNASVPALAWMNLAAEVIWAWLKVD